MRNRLFFLLVVLLLGQVVVSQRGGGGSSGGGSRGGSSSFSSYRSRSYSYTPSCFERCFGEPICIQDCQRSSSTAGIIVGSIFGGLCLGGLSCFACHKCKCRRLCKGNVYQKLQKQYNVVDTTSMSSEQFRSKRDRVLYLLNRSQNDSNFALEQTTEKHLMRCRASVVRQENNLSQIRFDGGDKFGTWKAKGFILCRDGQVFMWFYKEYDDKEAAGQTDQWEDLVYQSERYDDRNGMEGKWFYLGHEYSDQYSGKWKLWQANQFGQNSNYNPQPQNTYGNPNPANPYINPPNPYYN